jgi:replicative superfamily II helicase
VLLLVLSITTFVVVRVNPKVGLFYFDDSYRPIPLSQQYIGVKVKDAVVAKAVMNRICFEKVIFLDSGDNIVF